MARANNVTVHDRIPTRVDEGPVVPTAWRHVTEASARQQHVLQAVKALLAARTMEEHHSALKSFSADVQWDAPIILLQGREAVRKFMFKLKFLGQRLDFEPIVFQVDNEPQDKGSEVVEVRAIVHVQPRRRWWVPVIYLLPAVVDLQVTLRLAIALGASSDGSEDSITYLRGRFHNLPSLPSPVRVLNRWLLGHADALTERLWSSLSLTSRAVKTA